MTHAFFKALLFLAAGSVIIAMHHEQDIRRMGGLKKYMPITYWTSLVGSLALIGFPAFSGFFSKDSIIEAVHLANIPGAGFAYWMVLMGVFVTALYSFRMFFLVFHTDERFRQYEHHDHHGHGSHGGDPKESPWVVTLPLVLLAIPSVLAGYLIDPIVMGDFFEGVIYVAPEHAGIAHMQEIYHGVWGFMLHAFKAPAVYLALAGLATAWFIYIKRPDLADAVKRKMNWLYVLLDRKYYADEFNQIVFARGSVGLGRLFWKVGDAFLIDQLVVNGTAKIVDFFSVEIRHVQTGYLYHYTFAMILGLVGLLGWYVIL
jgi:NADH-quinone oxidoreductase subunit L